jgi:hypothetical protein
MRQRQMRGGEDQKWIEMGSRFSGRFARCGGLCGHKASSQGREGMERKVLNGIPKTKTDQRGG